MYKERKEDSDNGIQYRGYMGKEMGFPMLRERRTGREDTTGFMSIIYLSVCQSWFCSLHIYPRCIPYRFILVRVNFADPAAVLVKVNPPRVLQGMSPSRSSLVLTAHSPLTPVQRSMKGNESQGIIGHLGTSTATVVGRQG